MDWSALIRTNVFPFFILLRVSGPPATTRSHPKIKSASPLSFNSFEHPNDVRIHSHQQRVKKDGKSQILLAPASVTLLKFEK